MRRPAKFVELSEVEASMVLSAVAGGCPLFSGPVEIVGYRGRLLWSWAADGIGCGDEQAPDRFAACILVRPGRRR